METVFILIWLALWAAGIYLACRVAMWVLRSIVGATGKSWRGD
jgi:hypothetical protein